MTNETDRAELAEVIKSLQYALKYSEETWQGFPRHVDMPYFIKQAVEYLQAWQAARASGGWRPISDLPKKIQKGKTVLYFYKESDNSRMKLSPVITPKSCFGSRERTHFQLIDSAPPLTEE